MTEQEKDAFIVQLRSDVNKYREAYRLAKYQLDVATEELSAKRKASPMAESLAAVVAEYNEAVAKHPKFCDTFTARRNIFAVRQHLEGLREMNSEAPYDGESILREEMFEAVEAYLEGDKEHCLQELAQCGAVILRLMEYLKAEIEGADDEQQD